MQENKKKRAARLNIRKLRREVLEIISDLQLEVNAALGLGENRRLQKARRRRRALESRPRLIVLFFPTETTHQKL